MKRTLFDTTPDRPLYFDFIPDELLYLIIVELRTVNLFLAKKYTRVYDAYINNIHRGFLNPFRLSSIQTAKIYEYEKRLPDIVEKSKIRERQRIWKELPSPIKSTSTYWKKEYYIQKNVYELYRFLPRSFYIEGSSPMNYRNVIEIKFKQIIYARSLNLENKKMPNSVVIYISDKPKELYRMIIYTIDYEDEFNRNYNQQYYESYNWKDIWDNIPVEDQNAILHQNGFPLKN